MARPLRPVRTATLEAKKFLADVPEEYVFRCADGRMLKNIHELADALRTMSDDTYAFHANESKNDFTNWVKDIVKDDKLAEDLRRAPNRAAAAKITLDRITYLRPK